MFRHKGQPPLPLLDIEILFAKPSISIVLATAPKSLRNVVVQMENYILSCELFGNIVPDLQSCRVSSKLGIVGKDVIENSGSVLLSQGIDYRPLQRLVGAVAQIVIHHLDGKAQSNGIEAEFRNPGDYIFH